MKRSPVNVERVLTAVSAFEKVVESGKQLCEAGERSHLFGVFFAMMAAFAIRSNLAIGGNRVPKIDTDGLRDGSGSVRGKQQRLPTLDAVRAAMPKLVAALISENNATAVSALEEMGVLALCPIPGEQLFRMDRMTANVENATRLVLLVELALLAIELRQFDEVNRYVTEARTLNPSSWEFYNLCILEGLLALNAGDRGKAVQWLDKSSNACQVDEYVSLACAVRAPNFLLAQELLAQGERAAVIRHLLDCNNVWGYIQLPIDEWIDTIERGGIPVFQRCEGVQALNQCFWKLQMAWIRAGCLDGAKGLPPNKPNWKSPAEVLAARNRLIEEQRRQAGEIVRRNIMYLDD